MTGTPDDAICSGDLNVVKMHLECFQKGRGAVQHGRPSSALANGELLEVLGAEGGNRRNRYRFNVGGLLESAVRVSRRTGQKRDDARVR